MKGRRERKRREREKEGNLREEGQGCRGSGERFPPIRG